jgi:hypothetical protein
MSSGYARVSTADQPLDRPNRGGHIAPSISQIRFAKSSTAAAASAPARRHSSDTEPIVATKTPDPSQPCGRGLARPGSQTSLDVRAADVPPVGGLLDSENCSCPFSQKPVQKRFLPQEGGSLSVEGIFAKKIFRRGRRFRCRRLRSTAVTRLWPRGIRSPRPHSSLINGLLGVEGIFKRKDSHRRSGRGGGLAQVKDPDLCGRQAGGGGGFGALTGL